MLCMQVVDLQVALKEEQIIVEEKKAATQALIESIGKEKAVADEAVEASRADEEAAATLQVTLLLLRYITMTTPQRRKCISELRNRLQR